MCAQRIDIHHHYAPGVFRQAIEDSGGDPSGWAVPEWSAEEDLKFMEGRDIGTAMLSITSPGAPIFSDPSESAQLARRCNDIAADLKNKQPSKFGFLAALPDVLDKKGTLEELSYSLDTLKADGVTLFTRYGKDNHYLGHPDIDYLWEELDRRSAVVFIHPTHPVDTTPVNKHLPQPVIDYPFETTKTAVDMIINGTVRKYKNVKIVLSHAGGALPYLVERVAVLAPYLQGGERTPQDLIEEAREFYYDTALSGGSNQLLALESFAKPGHILYGSDYPYAPPSAVDYHTNGLDSFKFKDPEMINNINRKNALELFPRLK